MITMIMIIIIIICNDEVRRYQTRDSKSTTIYLNSMRNATG
jgi:hypothetical protein